MNWLSRKWSPFREGVKRHLPTIVRAWDLFVMFWRRWRRLSNQARTLLLSLALAPPALLLLLVLTVFDVTEAANNDFVTLLALLLSLVDIGLGFVVLITLEGIKSTEEFLENVIEMLREAEAGHEFFIVAPTFNVEAKKNRFLFSKYRALLSKRLKEGVRVTIAYYQNPIQPTAFLTKNGSDKTTELNINKSAPFIEFHRKALENPDEETTNSSRYFTACYQFLKELRDANASELVYAKPIGSAPSVHPFFVGNLNKGDFFLGEFTVNEGLPQDARVDCEGERVRNKYAATSLTALVRQHAGSVKQL